MQEIERKWIVKQLSDVPDLDGQTPLPYESHFLFDADGIEVRVQKKGDKYEFERKQETSELTRTCQKFEVSKAEFELFKGFAIGSIERESYQLGDISIKVYKGRHAGLMRAEVEFESEEAANAYNPPDWFGEEITNTELGKDKRLMRLGDGEFANLRVNFSEN